MESVNDRLLLRKVTLRLIPFLFLLYIIAYLDRVNVGFAKLHMQKALGFSDTVYGTGAGIFFLGYFLFEVPSNLILERVGARRWIARIMITWGIIASCMMFTNSVTMFYIMRFLLGLGEAGFFPGMILYLTYWYTTAERARMIALFMSAIAFANIIGSPVSGFLVSIKGWGLAGWQWLFLLEGIPAFILGFVVLVYLPDSPRTARWLKPEERDRLLERLEAEHDKKRDHSHTSLKGALRQTAVWQLCAIYFSLNVGSYGINMWLPQIVKDFGKLSDVQIGFITALPYIAGAIGLLINGTHSDKTQERRLHVTFAAVFGAVGLMLSALNSEPVARLLFLSMAQMGLMAMLAPFWTLPSSFLVGAAAAGGIAFINSVGNLGGFVGPFIMGWLKDTTHSFQTPLLTLAGVLFVGSLITYSLRVRTTPPQ